MIDKIYEQEKYIVIGLINKTCVVGDNNSRRSQLCNSTDLSGGTFNGSCIREATEACFLGCCGSPLLRLAEPPDPAAAATTTTTVAATHVDFVAATTSSLSPDTQFTDPESLPSLSKALSRFNRAYPQYAMTREADGIREQEYSHLSVSNRVCLDYTGFGLFSYAQQNDQAFAMDNPVASSSSSSLPVPPPRKLDLPFFNVCYKSASLKSQVLHGGHDSVLESAVKKRIMDFLNICENDYSMVFTANRKSAFKLLAESYPFQSNKRLITVYDYQSESVRSMIENSQKRGAKVMPAEFLWPSMRIQSTKLKKMVINKRKKKDRGLFVFPLQSRMTGVRYSYLWMSVARANGWHIALDACALGPKDMETLGLSLIQPDFLICSFFKIFGEDPSGFGCLFVKKTSASVLESSAMARSIGIVSLVPVKKKFDLADYSSELDSHIEQKIGYVSRDGSEDTRSFSGPITENGVNPRSLSSTSRQFDETSEAPEAETRVEPEIVEAESPSHSFTFKNTKTSEIDRNSTIEFRGLDHADSMGLIKISNRARCLINWLVNALLKLQHPHSEEGLPLIKIYGPRVKFDRGPAVAFNVFDWKGEKVEPVLVQKLADRSNISLSYGFLHHLCFSNKYEGDRERVLETRRSQAEGTARNKRKEKADMGITVVTAAIGFLTNFEDLYRVWAFVARFLDADFVEKERWRYTALNQNIIEV